MLNVQYDNAGKGRGCSVTVFPFESFYELVWHVAFQMGSLVQNLRRQLVPKRQPDLVKYVKEVYDAPNLLQVLKKGGWRAIFDGSLAEQVRFAKTTDPWPSTCDSQAGLGICDEILIRN